MNYQWSLIEKTLVKKRFYKIPEYFYGAYEPIVPVELRRMYFREYLRWQRIKYNRDHKKWLGTCKTIKEEHLAKLAELNAFSVLTNGPIIRTDPELPPPPMQTMFIPKYKLNEMVREAIDHKNEWDEIIKGNIIPLTLLKLKTMTA